MSILDRRIEALECGPARPLSFVEKLDREQAERMLCANGTAPSRMAIAEKVCEINAM